MKHQNLKLYQQVADKITSRILDGAYAPGKRLPSERDLSLELNVSRPTVREALIALEIRGFVEARHGSGVYVVSNPPTETSKTELDIGPFELIEARRIIEGEAAALAAHSITDEELDELEELIELMDQHRDSMRGERADGAFHAAIAAATRNSAIASVVENLWELRYRSPLCVSIFARGRDGGVQQPVDDHSVILQALRARDSEAAREAMRGHLDNVFKRILEATELDAIERVRLDTAVKREEFERRAKLQAPRGRARKAREGA